MIEKLITIVYGFIGVVLVLGLIMYLYQSIKRVLSDEDWTIDINVHYYYENKNEDKNTEDPNSLTTKKD